MGDFVVYQRNIVDENVQSAMLKTLAAQGSKNPRIIKDDSYNILIFDKTVSPVVNLIQNENGDFCASSGCFFYKGQTGKAALELYLTGFNPDQFSPFDFLGIFTLIVKKNGRLFIITDPMGASRVFHNVDHSIWSSSFLALSENMKGLTVDKQGVYEYCFQETNYGATTPFNEIKHADSLCYFELMPDGIKSHPKNIPISFEQTSSSYDDLIEEHCELLQKQMQAVIAAYGDNIITALSGGYDTRLMLSLLRKDGITPELYVYGSDDSPDVKVAKAIAKGEGFKIDHINKAHFPIPPVSDYATVIKENFYALDGYPNEGIFDFGINMATRRERTKNGKMVLNGGGGGIYRNYIYLPDRSYHVTDLLNVFYSRYSKVFCTDAFSEQDYRGALQEKIKTALGLTSDRISRTQLEYVGPAFRLRYWTSKDNSNNTRLGSFLIPFICYETTVTTLKMPLEFMLHGRFQGDLINRIDPALAGYLSDYGYRFNQPVPFIDKVKKNMTIYRPVFLRRYSYAIQHKMATLNVPTTLSEEYLGPILPNGTPYMNEYFKIAEIKDAALLGRVLTLEYLFQHLGVS